MRVWSSRLGVWRQRYASVNSGRKVPIVFDESPPRFRNRSVEGDAALGPGAHALGVLRRLDSLRNRWEKGNNNGS